MVAMVLRSLTFRICQNKETGVEPFFEANFTQILAPTMKLRRYALNFKAEALGAPSGAGDGNRTHDLFLGKEALYHSTTPAFSPILLNSLIRINKYSTSQQDHLLSRLVLIRLVALLVRQLHDVI